MVNWESASAAAASLATDPVRSVTVAPGADRRLELVPGGFDLFDVREAHHPYQASVPN